MILTYIILFVFYLVLDMLYAHYILALTESKAFKSAITSSIIMGMSLFGTIEIIRNHWNAIPIIIGCFCGTYLTVKLQQLKQFQLTKEQLCIIEMKLMENMAFGDMTLLTWTFLKFLFTNLKMEK